MPKVADAWQANTLTPPWINLAELPEAESQRLAGIDWRACLD